MKKLFFILVLMVISICSYSQNIAINATGTPPVASAILDVSSNSKGILIPRMTTAECGAIISPAAGLLIYDTDKKTFMYHNGTSWVDIASPTANNGWKIQGNSGTSSATNFIGTTDNIPLVFRTNNVQSGLLDPQHLNYYIGQYAGISNIGGVGNVGVGEAALKLNTDGIFNTAIGTESLYCNTTGMNNVAAGNNSLKFNIDGDDNAAIGVYALQKNTTGGDNTAMGYSAMRNNIDGQLNAAVGSNALYSNNNGTGNTSIGSGSMYNNTTGGSNVAVGNNSMRANLSGFFNMANGVSAMYNNTTGSNNTAAGTSAMHDNTTGYSNVAIGRDALYGNTIKGNLVAVGDSALRFNGINATTSFHSTRNTAVGSKALMNNTSGYSNTALGFEAISNNTTGKKNTAIGVHALLNSTTGSRNTAVGDSVLILNADGSSNTAMGSNALEKNTGGDYNSAVGGRALSKNQTGDYNAAFGDLALSNNLDGFQNTAIGNSAVSSNTSGDYNTGIGYAAIINNNTGNKNTGLGYLADVLVSNLNYATAIGAESFVGCNNCLALGGTTNSSVFVGINNPTPTSDLHIKQKSDVAGNTTRGIKLSRSNGSNYWRTYVDGSSFLTFEFNDLGTGNWAWINTTGDFISGSDQSIKKDVTPMIGVLDKIKLLQPKTYHYLHQEESDPLKFGFIAQQVEGLFPEFVSTREDGLKGLAYQDFAVIAIKAIQEQQVTIEDLQRQINELKALIVKD